MVLLKTTKRVIKLPSSFQNICATPKEILNIPSQVISFKTNEKISNINIYQPHFYPLAQYEQIFNDSNFLYGPKTLHFVLETHRGFYDSDKILKYCLKYNNFQAASKVSYLECYFTDSLNYQLQSLAKIIPKDFKFTEKIEDSGEIDTTHVQLMKTFDISFSPSLESMKQFNDDLESQGGEEELYDEGVSGDLAFDIDENKKILVRNTILEYVDSIDKNLINNDLSLLHDHCDKRMEVEPEETVEIEESTPNGFKAVIGPMGDCVANLTDTAIIDYATRVVMFYIERTQNTENHILMQNILIKSMDFWLSNNLPVDILENILLKNMAKYFYPLSILLFCKNFNNNNLGENSDDINTETEEIDSSLTPGNSPEHQSQKSYMFLKQLSTKFCLQLCSMVLKNVQKSDTKPLETID